MKILILGARGMLGQDLVKVLSAEHELTAWDLAELDITNREDVLGVISKLKPELVINAAAYTAVDKCETEFELAVKINGHAVGYLAEACEAIGATLIHFSTDYVFNGQKEAGYDEDEQKDPINAYGRSKALGEDLIQEKCSKFYICRIAWLYGAGGANFVDTMLKLSKTQDMLKVVDDQIGSPTYTIDVSNKVAEIINNSYQYGIYHIPNDGRVSWYEFASEIFRQAGIDIFLVPVATAEFPRPARRPSFSVLNNNKTSKLPGWKEALARYLKRNPNANPPRRTKGQRRRENGKLSKLSKSRA
ncbi:MAG: dTDP-4-dehydrorhamnose reductase [Candidatus Gracilibacteria bacterium]|nr:dTDP-4-dehydrorhamnose reductase [Candidatus Gracilibacteria bacterium]